MGKHLRKAAATHLAKALGLLMTGQRPLFMPTVQPYDAGWDILYPIGHLWLPLEKIRARHHSGEIIPLDSSPHASFVMDFLGRGGSREPWREYVRNQHGLTAKQLDEAESRFERLIFDRLENLQQFTILVRISYPFAVIVDGFHRATIESVLSPQERVRCAIL